MASLGLWLVIGWLVASSVAIRGMLNAFFFGSSHMEANNTLDLDKAGSDRPAASNRHLAGWSSTMIADMHEVIEAMNVEHRYTSNPSMQIKGYDSEDVPVPSLDEVKETIRAMEACKRGEKVDLAVANGPIRFAAAAYGQFNPTKARTWESSPFEEKLLHTQLHQHKHTDDMVHDEGLHAHVYLYDYGDHDYGVVVSYKGSTFLSDWWTNIIAFPKRVLHGKVHQGFLGAVSALYEEMLHVPMPPQFKVPDKVLQRLPGDVAEKVVAEAAGWSLYTYVRSGIWRWILFVGHSLGGALAQIAADQLSVELPKKTIFVATFGSPIAGDADFAAAMNRNVHPNGGLSFGNPNDPIRKLGFILGTHAGIDVNMEAESDEVRSNPLDAHMRYTVPPMKPDGKVFELVFTSTKNLQA